MSEVDDEFHRVCFADLQGTHRVFYNGAHVFDVEAVPTGERPSLKPKNPPLEVSTRDATRTCPLEFRFQPRPPLPRKNANGSMIKNGTGMPVMDTPPDCPSQKAVAIEKWGEPFRAYISTVDNDAFLAQKRSDPDDPSRARIVWICMRNANDLCEWKRYPEYWIGQELDADGSKFRKSLRQRTYERREAAVKRLNMERNSASQQGSPRTGSSSRPPSPPVVPVDVNRESIEEPDIRAEQQRATVQMQTAATPAPRECSDGAALSAGTSPNPKSVVGQPERELMQTSREAISLSDVEMRNVRNIGNGGNLTPEDNDDGCLMVASISEHAADSSRAAAKKNSCADSVSEGSTRASSLAVREHDSEQSNWSSAHSSSHAERNSSLKRVALTGSPDLEAEWTTGGTNALKYAENLTSSQNPKRTRSAAASMR